MNTATNENTTTELVPTVSITALLDRRRAALQTMREGLALVQKAHANLGAGLSLPELELTQDNRFAAMRVCGTFQKDLETVMAALTHYIDQSAWDYLMNESGLQTFMDKQARSEWRDQVNGKDVPALTPENIAATFRTVHDQRGDMFERGVINVFRRLSWEYKTNLPVKFGKRIILRSFARDLTGEPKWLESWPINDRCNELDDLTRVFHLFDDKPEPDHRNGIHAIASEHRAARNFSTEYLEVKWFKNGNAHITFQRLDLVDKLNKVLTKHYPDALPAKG